MEDAALLFQSVSLGGERQDGLIIGRQTGETELGKIVDEEVELGGHTAQTRFYQPWRGGGEKMCGKSEREREISGGTKTTCCFAFDIKLLHKISHSNHSSYLAGLTITRTRTA